MVDEAADFEACQMLTDNAENLSSAISEALHRTESASIRVMKKVGKVCIIKTDIHIIKIIMHASQTCWWSYLSL